MADCLVYWKQFWGDYENEKDSDFLENDWDWYDKRKRFFNQLERGDTLWVAVSGGAEHPDEWRLLQGIVIRDLKFVDKYNHVDGRPYCVVGDREKSQKFDFDSQLDLANLLHELEFVSGKKITKEGKSIGLQLEQFRPLSPSGSRLLEQYARNLILTTPETSLEEKQIEKIIKRAGAGFGSPEMNRKVGDAACSYVTEWYESHGWSVKSVEAEKCGYDLVCVKGSVEKHVEVKGVQGEVLSFIITAGEVRQAQSNSKFIICIVTSSLSKRPKLFRYTGKEFAAKFRLSPLAYKAVLQA